MSIKWKRMRKNIPSKVSCGKMGEFDVVFTDDLPLTKNNRKLYGLTKFNPNVILINKDLDDKHTVTTFFHEWLHTFKLYKNCHLTEKQTLAFEQKFHYFHEFFSMLLLEPKKVKRVKND